MSDASGHVDPHPAWLQQFEAVDKRWRQPGPEEDEGHLWNERCRLSSLISETPANTKEGLCAKLAILEDDLLTTQGTFPEKAHELDGTRAGTILKVSREVLAAIEALPPGTALKAG